MKKIIVLITVFIIIFICIGGGQTQAKITTGGENSNTTTNSEIVEDISQKLIRFHVIANSDTKEDQALKLQVRDKILAYVSPLLKESSSLQQSREILRNENENILNICRNTIKEKGYSYDVTSTLSREHFPVKTYGNITLPQGEYEAYRVIIGSGAGKNWWCVMFPPLCFVDITKGEVAEEETKTEMKKVLTDKEYDLVDNSEDDNLVVRFKIVDLFKSIFCK